MSAKRQTDVSVKSLLRRSGAQRSVAARCSRWTASSYRCIQAVVFGVVFMSVATRVQLVDSQFGVNESVCQWETFNASCSTVEEVILVTSARYGRMRVGRCIPVDYHIGCSADVTSLIDLRCSGQRSCLVPIPDPEMFDAQPCRKDLIAYLDAAYKCVRPLACFPASESTTAVVNVATGTSGYLSGRCLGNAWQVRASRGQRLELTLYDHVTPPPATESGDGDVDQILPRDLPVEQQQRPLAEKSFDESCPPLVRITEKLTSLDREGTGDEVTASSQGVGVQGSRDVIVRIIRACDSPIRQRIVYVSRGPIVTVTVLSTSTSGRNLFASEVDSAAPGQHDRVNFLLHYRVTGCAELQRPENALIARSNDVTVVWCNTTGERWHLVCRNNRWIGGMPTNCSSASVPVTNIAESPVGNFDIMRADQVVSGTNGGHLLVGRYISIGMALAIILGCIVGLICGTLIVLLAISFRRRQRWASRNSKQLSESTDKTCSCSTDPRQRPDIYRLINVMSQSSTLSRPEVTSTTPLDDVVSTTPGIHRASCLCSCHAQLEDSMSSSTPDTGNCRPLTDTFLDEHCSMHHGELAELEHRGYRCRRHLISQQTDMNLPLPVHSSSKSNRRASYGDGIESLAEVPFPRALWMSDCSGEVG